MNGIDLGPVGQFIEAVKAEPDAAHITFRATSKWAGGARADVAVTEFLSNGAAAQPAGRSFTLAVDEPGVLGGTDRAPNPVEYLAAGLCGCLTAGIATNAELFGVALDALEVEVDIDFDVIGLLAIDRAVPTGATGIAYTVRLKGKDGTTPEQLRKCKEVIDGKSPVLRTLAGAIPISTRTVIA